MSARAIREHDGKLILGKYVPLLAGSVQVARISVETTSAVLGELETVPANLQGSRDTPTASDLSQYELQQQLNGLFLQVSSKHPWLETGKLVVKPDQLIKRRGKSGHLLLNCTWDEARLWISERAGKELTVPRHIINLLYSSRSTMSREC